MSTNGTRKLPLIAPTVLTARSVPALRPDARRLAQERGGSPGTIRPRTIVVSRTTGTAIPTISA